jgi:hypothetical protein
MQNMTEEAGQYTVGDLEVLQKAGICPEWIVGVPHPQLFQRFCAAIGGEVTTPLDDNSEVICWREMFLSVLAEGSPAEAVGALGLGTEAIISTMYTHFLPALDGAGISPRDGVFFPLHTIVDDHHQQTLLEIAAHYAQTPAGRCDLQKGMRKALFLRNGFWEWMLVRAQTPPLTGTES